MCGICGIFAPDGRPVDSSRVERMRDAMMARGPDGFGLAHGQGYALGHRRLSIIDLSDCGRQPMENEDGSVLITFNGEIYNFADLQPELVAAGHVFRSKSDTEVLIHGYEAWGLDGLLRRVRGMFAFALLDCRRNEIHLARDPFGKKPLYYRWAEGELVFASSAQAMKLALAATPEIDLLAVDALFWNNHIPGRRTIFAGMEKLLPGHAWTLDRNGKSRDLTHWEPECYHHEYGVSLDTWVDRTEDALTTAVRRRFVADVPVGTMLSGGVDSGLVTALAAKAIGKVRTFTVASDDPAQDESGLAALVADRYHTDHQPLSVKSDVRRDLIRLVSAMGEPFADSSAINVFAISELARRWITVVLTGDGGDEGFGGYQDLFAAHCAGRLARALPRFVLKPFAGAADLLTRATGKESLRKAGTLLRLAGDGPEVFFGQLPPVLAELRERLFTPDAHAQLLGHNPRQHVFDVLSESHREGSWADRLMEVYFRTILPDDFLTKVDLASMGVSMEARCPFLDVDVVNLAMKIPPEVRFTGLRRKALLRRLARRHLPDVIADRRKQGFTVAVRLWFRQQWTDLVQEFILGPHVERRGWFRRDALRQIVEEHRRGVSNYGELLWSLLVLELWLRLAVDGTLSPGDVL